MKVLYFSRYYTSHDYRFLSALQESGQQVSYMTLERQGHHLESRTLPPGIVQLDWIGGKRSARLVDGPRLVADLRRVLSNNRPDLVLAGPLQRSALLVALAGYQPLVSMSWGYDLILDAGRNHAWRWATKFALEHSAAMVGDCDTIRQLAIAHGMPGDRIVTFPWGIDLRHFTPPANPRPVTGPFTLLSTRNWEAMYGGEVIARAFVLAAQKNPDLRLVMLGNGSQAGLLEQILKTGNTLPRVEFPGQITFENLPAYYQAADLYLSASHSDGTSISLLEALACGLPALVSDIPGNREWISPGRQGWTFQDGDANALAQAILHAAERRQDLAEMSLAARRLAENRADWQKNFPLLQHAFDIALRG